MSQHRKQVFITGGLGFLGSFLSDRFLKENYSVIAIDNLYTGSTKNVSHLSANPFFKYVHHDITTPLPSSLKDEPCDLILNFACPASPPHYQKDPIYTTKVSVLGIMHMLELARERQATILHASTSEVYGDPLISPQSEDYRGYVNPIGIRSCYDEGKRVAESLITDYVRSHGIDGRIVRIFNTYGPRMDCDDGRVVSNFITQALRGVPLTVYGDGTQTRSFCYVSDLIEGIYRHAVGEKRVAPVNIGNDQTFTMIALAEMVKKLTHSQAPIVFKPLPEDDPKQRCPDLSRAKAWLGFSPQINLETGLKLTIPYFREALLSS